MESRLEQECGVAKPSSYISPRTMKPRLFAPSLSIHGPSTVQVERIRRVARARDGGKGRRCSSSRFQMSRVQAVWVAGSGVARGETLCSSGSEGRTRLDRARGRPRKSSCAQRGPGGNHSGRCSPALLTGSQETEEGARFAASSVPTLGRSAPMIRATPRLCVTGMRPLVSGALW